MESFSVTEELSVDLGTPVCELRWEHCSKTAVMAFRVHGCAFYYACQSCGDGMLNRIASNLRRFTQLRCRRCGVDFSDGKYYEKIVL